jgi:hypothetical protein
MNNISSPPRDQIKPMRDPNANPQGAPLRPRQLLFTLAQQATNNSVG